LNWSGWRLSEDIVVELAAAAEKEPAQGYTGIEAAELDFVQYLDTDNSDYILSDWPEERVVASAGVGKGQARVPERLFLGLAHNSEADEEAMAEFVVVEVGEAIVAAERVVGPIG